MPTPYYPPRPYQPKAVFRRGDDFIRLLNKEFLGLSEDLQRYAAPTFQISTLTAAELHAYGDGVGGGVILVAQNDLCAAGSWLFPRSMVPNSPLFAAIRYARDGNGVGNFNWKMDYEIARINDVPVSGSISNNQVWSDVCQDTGTSGKHLVTLLGPVWVDGTALDPLVTFEFGRSSTGGLDTAVDSATFYALSFIYLDQARGTRYPQPLVPDLGV